MSTLLLSFLLGLGLNTCVALLWINTHFLGIYVLAEISLFFFLTRITRIEGLSNLYCVVEISHALHAYSVSTGLVPKPSGWSRWNSAACVKGESSSMRIVGRSSSV